MEFIELDLENASEEELVSAIEKNNSKLISVLQGIAVLETKPQVSVATKDEKGTVSGDSYFEIDKDEDSIDFEDEIDYYFSMINRFGLNDDLYENILTSLPSKKNPNYRNIILRIKMELLKNIKDINDLLSEEKDELSFELLKEFRDEIDLNMEKIKTIELIDRSVDIKESSETVRNNLIFVPTSGGNIRVLEELNDISQEYFQGFKGLFDSIIDGSFKNVKRFNSSNSKNSGVSEVKDHKIRVVFDRIGPTEYAIITAFVKKTDKDRGYLEALNLKVKNYEAQKDSLKSNLKNDEFMKMQSEYTTELLTMLESSDKMAYAYRKGEK